MQPRYGLDEDNKVLPVFRAYLKDPEYRRIDLVYLHSDLVDFVGQISLIEETGHSSGVSSIKTAPLASPFMIPNMIRLCLIYYYQGYLFFSHGVLISHLQFM
jgi:hypothetical protein